MKRLRENAGRPFNFSTFQPFNFSTCLTAAQCAAQTAAQGAAKTAAELAEIDRGAGATEDGERALVRGVNAADGEAGEVPAAVE